MKGAWGMLVCGCLLGAACSQTAQSPPPPAPAQPARAAGKSFDPSVGPSTKEILRALLANQDVALSVDPSCSGVGTEPTDTNIGDYISGFLAEQKSERGKNWLDISAKPAPATGAEPMWLCNVVIRHVDGEDRWGWGVSFLVKSTDHTVIRNSFRCTGSG